MKTGSNQSRLVLLIAASTLLLAGCGSGMGGCNGQQNDQNVIGTAIVDNSPAGAEEGPQYQEPRMENLQGTPQKFPARYPLKRYPNSRVVMAYVRPNLHPGDRNCVLLTSSDKNFVVAGYYQQNLTGEGWKLVQTEGNTAYSRQLYRKGDQFAEVVVTPDPHGVNHVQLFTGPYLAPMQLNNQIKPDRDRPELPVREN